MEVVHGHRVTDPGAQVVCCPLAQEHLILPGHRRRLTGLQPHGFERQVPGGPADGRHRGVGHQALLQADAVGQIDLHRAVGHPLPLRHIHDGLGHLRWQHERGTFQDSDSVPSLQAQVQVLQRQHLTQHALGL